MNLYIFYKFAEKDRKQEPKLQRVRGTCRKPPENIWGSQCHPWPEFQGGGGLWRPKSVAGGEGPPGETQEEVNSHLKKVLRGADVVRGGGAAVK